MLPSIDCKQKQEAAHLQGDEARKKIEEGVEAESFIRLHVVQARGWEGKSLYLTFTPCFFFPTKVYATCTVGDGYNRVFFKVVRRHHPTLTGRQEIYLQKKRERRRARPLVPGNERGNYEMTVEPQHIDGEFEVPSGTGAGGCTGTGGK